MVNMSLAVISGTPMSFLVLMSFVVLLCHLWYSCVICGTPVSVVVLLCHLWYVYIICGISTPTLLMLSLGHFCNHVASGTSSSLLEFSFSMPLTVITPVSLGTTYVIMSLVGGGWAVSVTMSRGEASVTWGSQCHYVTSGSLSLCHLRPLVGGGWAVSVTMSLGEAIVTWGNQCHCVT